MTLAELLTAPFKAKASTDADLERLRALAASADRREGISLRGLSREERRKVMMGLPPR